MIKFIIVLLILVACNSKPEVRTLKDCPYSGEIRMAVRPVKGNPNMVEQKLEIYCYKKGEKK